MPDIIPDDMPDRLPQYMPEDMSDVLPEYVLPHINSRCYAQQIATIYASIYVR